MDKANIATILVAVIAAVSAYASQRAAARASVMNTSVESRLEMEKEAYDRARAYDTETIRRQDLEIEELRSANEKLHKELRVLRARLERLERGLPSQLEEILRERLQEPDAE